MREIVSGIVLLAGATIGAGIFGIPFVTARVGYPLGVAWLLALTGVVILANLAYATAIVRDKSKTSHQLVGYAGLYLGPVGRKLALITTLIGQWGAGLAYLIGIGQFLGVIFDAPAYAVFFSCIVFAIVATVTLFNVRFLVTLEGGILVAMIGVLSVLTVLGIPHIQSFNLQRLPILETSATILAPYGVFMTALMGFAVIPEVWRVFPKKKSSASSFRLALVLGTLIPAILYLIFQWVVVGVSGPTTSQESIRGLIPYLSPAVIKLGALFGSLSMLSSYLTTSYSLKDTFLIDYKRPRIAAWSLTLFPSLFLFVLGLQSFIIALELVGTWLGTLNLVLIFAMYCKSFAIKNTDPLPRVC